MLRITIEKERSKQKRAKTIEIKVINILLALVICICFFIINKNIDILAYFTDKKSLTNVFTINTKYTVTFDSNSGTGTMNDQIISYNVSTPLTLNEFEKIGYTFTGWNTSTDGNGTPYTNGQDVTNIGNITLYAQWQIDTYSIGYILDGGTVAIANPNTYTVETASFTLNNPTKTGYTFKGWSGTDLTGDTNTSVTIAQGSTENRYYTANYTPNIYAITLDNQSVNIANTITIYEKYNTGYYIDNNATLQMTTSTNGITIPTQTGYTFTGYYTEAIGGTQCIDAYGMLTNYASAIEFIENGTLYAHWNIDTYSIDYILDDGTIAISNPDSYTIETTSFTLNNPEKTGYTFKGWSGTDLTGDTNTSVTITQGSTGYRSYTANYTANTYYIRFNENDGSGLMSNQTMTYYISANLITNNFTRTGYTFTGWNTIADGSGTPYTNSQLVSNLTVVNNATIDLYAQWSKNPIKYAVQIYGINQDVDENDNLLGLTFGPAVGANYNNSYVTHEYEEISENPGNYYVKIVTHTVAADGSETISSEYLIDSSSNNVTRTESQVTAREDICLHNMTWAEIAAENDKTVFEDCMLCGDTKSVCLILNSTIASENAYDQFGDGAAVLDSSINSYYNQWNISGGNAKNDGGYSSSHIRATLVGQDSKTNVSYAGNTNLITNTCLFSCIENDLKNVITAKKVKYVTGTSLSSYILNDDISDKIWLFSEREIYGTGEYSGQTLEGIGTTGDGYSKFGNTESKYYMSSYNSFNSISCRECYYENDSKHDWFLRSVILNNDKTGFATNSGSIYHGGNALKDGTGIAFGFCIE